MGKGKPPWLTGKGRDPCNMERIKRDFERGFYENDRAYVPDVEPQDNERMRLFREAGQRADEFIRRLKHGSGFGDIE